MYQTMSDKSKLISVSVLLLCSSTNGFHASVGPLKTGTPIPLTNSLPQTALQMGLFDGVREAFSAPALEQTAIDKNRETPIDRWMGWSVVSENDQQEQKTVAADFVDSMDPANYVIVELTKPMGIVFEENDADHGGIFVQSLKEDGAAFRSGIIQEGDQLVAVNQKKVSGVPFDDALGAIVDCGAQKTKLTFFRGSAKQFYGPTGASQKWLDEFIGVVKEQNPVESA